MSVIDDLIAKFQGSDYYDKGLAAASSAAQRRAADLQSQYDVGRQNLQGQYDFDSNTINHQLEQALHGLTNSYGNKGTIHSSIYVNDQGNTENNAQNQLNAAALRRTQGLSGLDQGLKSGQTDILNMLTGADSDAASRSAAARHQAELEAQQAQFQQDQLNYQRQGQQDQVNYYNQMLRQQQNDAAQQRASYSRMMSAMHPITYPTGAIGYPQQSYDSSGVRQAFDSAAGGLGGNTPTSTTDRFRNQVSAASARAHQYLG